MKKTIPCVLLFFCMFFKQMKSKTKKFKQADDAVAIAVLMLIGGLVVVAMLLIFAAFLIMNIDKIAMAVLILGVGMLAIIGSLKLAQKGFGWIKQKM